MIFFKWSSFTERFFHSIHFRLSYKNRGFLCTLLHLRPSDSTVSEDARMKPKIVVSLALTKVATGVADPECLFRIPDPTFSIPDPGSKRCRIRIRIKKLFLSSQKYDQGCSFRIRIFSHPGSRDQKSTGSRIRTRNHSVRSHPWTWSRRASSMHEVILWINSEKYLYRIACLGLFTFCCRLIKQNTY
jgi:hypothetical protein